MLHISNDPGMIYILNNERAQHPLSWRVAAFAPVRFEVFIQFCPCFICKAPQTAADHGCRTKQARVAEGKGGRNGVVVEVEEGGHDDEDITSKERVNWKEV